MIPYGRQSISEADVDAVVGVLRGDWLTQGPAVEEFENRLAAETEAQFCVAYSSGTAALHGAVAAAGIGPGDVVATTPLTFAASGACARYVGADLRLVDIEPKTCNMDLGLVPPEIDAVVAVHYAGNPIDLAAMTSRPRVVIEDAAHALGARTASGPVGNCAHSDMTCFSFHPVKTVTAGEGGAVTTNDPALAKRLRSFRHHGIERTPEKGPWAYEISDVGYNYRMTDIQAALGHSQLGRLREFVSRRNELAARYVEKLSGLPIDLPYEPGPDVVHGRHLYPIQIDDRGRVVERLRDHGIGTQVHYVPLYEHRAYVDKNLSALDFPNCDAAYQRLLSIPLFPAMTIDDQDRVVAALEDAL